LLKLLATSIVNFTVVSQHPAIRIKKRRHRYSISLLIQEEQHENWHVLQLSGLAWVMGGFHWARLWHFLIMIAIALFILGHLGMVALHGWQNFVSMLTGWKKDPEYLSE
jgi:hypothetical protein